MCGWIIGTQMKNCHLLKFLFCSPVPAWNEWVRVWSYTKHKSIEFCAILRPQFLGILCRLIHALGESHGGSYHRKSGWWNLGFFGFLVSSQNLPFSVEHLALKMGISPLHDWAAPAFARCIWNCIHPRPRYHMLALDLQPLERPILLTLVASLEPSLSKMPYCDDDDLKRGKSSDVGFCLVLIQTTSATPE